MTSSWFTETIKSYESGQNADVSADVEQARDDFRAAFEASVHNVVLPKFGDVVASARKHNFPAAVSHEHDSQQRLRAVNISMLARPGAELSDTMFGQCIYKIALQMRSQRVGQMMYVDNVPQIVGHNYFGGLESLEPETIDFRLQEFVEFALRNKNAVIS